MELEQCCVCSSPVANGSVVELTDEEKKTIGPDAPDSVVYCGSCWKICHNLQAGGQLLKGFYEKGLRELGVPDATERAELFHQKLMASATKKLH